MATATASQRSARRICAAAALILAAVPGAIVVTPAGTAAADVCAGVGRRITVSGCTNLADTVAPPPGYYAPLPEDVPPPPPPPPQITPCIGYNGRWVHANGCN